MSDCLVRIQEGLDSFSRQEKVVARYVLKHPEEVSAMTIADLSKKCKSSTATIMRFCYSLNFSGYREFIKSLYSDITAKKHETDETIYDIDRDSIANLNPDDTIRAVTKLNIAALEATLKVIDHEQVRQAVELIDKAKRVCIFALSGSKVVGYDAVFKFQRLGIFAESYDEAHEQILCANVLNKHDVAIVISYTGETSDILATASLLKEKGVPIISVTKFGDNPLMRLADVKLQHSTIGKGLRTYSTRSRTVQHNIIDILFVSLSQKRQNYLKQYYLLFRENNQ